MKKLWKVPIIKMTLIFLFINLIFLAFMFIPEESIHSFVFLFIKSSKYSFFVAYFLFYSSFLYVFMLFIIIKYKKNIIDNKKIDSFIYATIIIFSLSFSLFVLIILMIILTIIALFYGVISKKQIITNWGILYIIFASLLLVYQSIYLFLKIKKHITALKTYNYNEVANFFDISLKFFTLLSAIVTFLKFLEKTTFKSFDDKKPNLLLWISDFLQGTEIISWGATITILAAELIFLRNDTFKKVMNYLK